MNRQRAHSHKQFIASRNMVRSAAQQAERSVKRPLFFSMTLLNYIEEENFDENNENLKYLNDISGNLLHIFEVKDITSNLETNVKYSFYFAQKLVAILLL